jgi:transposase
MGYPLAEVAKMLGYTSRTIHNWIVLWNKGGIDALLPRPRAGRPRKIAAEVKDKIIHLLEHPEEVNETPWTAKKLHGFIRQEWSLTMGYSTLTHNLHEWGLRYNVPRPWPAEQDSQLRETFLQELKELYQQSEYEIWFGDESGILGDPRPRRRWMKRGKRGTVAYLGKHIRSNVIGAVNPTNGELSALIVSHMDSDMFQVFLNEFSQETSGRKIILILDNATWHKAGKLNWQQIKVKYLPPYSPDFNPIEVLWLVLKAKYFTDWIAKEQDELDNRIELALKSFFNNPIEVASICHT